MWNKLKASYEADLAAKTAEPIEVTLPDGKVVAGQSWRTTPYDVAKGIRSVHTSLSLTNYCILTQTLLKLLFNISSTCIPCFISFLRSK